MPSRFGFPSGVRAGGDAFFWASAGMGARITVASNATPPTSKPLRIMCDLPHRYRLEESRCHESRRRRPDGSTVPQFSMTLQHRRRCGGSSATNRESITDQEEWEERLAVIDNYEF